MIPAAEVWPRRSPTTGYCHALTLPCRSIRVSRHIQKAHPVACAAPAICRSNPFAQKGQQCLQQLLLAHLPPHVQDGWNEKPLLQCHNRLKKMANPHPTILIATSNRHLLLRHRSRASWIARAYRPAFCPFLPPHASQMRYSSESFQNRKIQDEAVGQGACRQEP